MTPFEVSSRIASLCKFVTCGLILSDRRIKSGTVVSDHVVEISAQAFRMLTRSADERQETLHQRVANFPFSLSLTSYC